MNPTLVLLAVGLLLQLAGVIGYFFNRQKAPLPWWIPTLVLIGWILVVVAFFFVYGDYGRAQKLPGATRLQNLLNQ